MSGRVRQREIRDPLPNLGSSRGLRRDVPPVPKESYCSSQEQEGKHCRYAPGDFFFIGRRLSKRPPQAEEQPESQ
jgi:hypothetical protein